MYTGCSFKIVLLLFFISHMISGVLCSYWMRSNLHQTLECTRSSRPSSLTRGRRGTLPNQIEFSFFQKDIPGGLFAFTLSSIYFSDKEGTSVKIESFEIERNWLLLPSVVIGGFLLCLFSTILFFSFVTCPALIGWIHRLNLCQPKSIYEVSIIG